MNPSQLIRTIKLSYNSKTPLLITGSPGTSKSSCVKQAAEELEVELIDMRISLKESIDLAGLPYRDTETNLTDYALPAELPREGKGILFLDEITSAPMPVQIASYSLILDRYINKYTLPDGWAVIAAGNTIADKAGVQRMSSALNNRFFHAEIEVALEDWLNWAMGNNIQQEIKAFLQYRPELLNKPDTDAKAYPTPRSWAMLATLLSHSILEEDTFQIMTGTIGEGAATELKAFLSMYSDMVTVEEVLASPEKAKIPLSPSGKYAISSSLAHRTDKVNLKSLFTYLSRMPGEFQALCIKDLIRLNKDIKTHPDYINWAVNNGTTLL